MHDGSGTVCGVFLPLISTEFFSQQLDPNSGKLTSALRKMHWLAAGDEALAAAQVDFRKVDRTERLLLLAQLAYLIGLLHKNGWVFGDLSFENIVFALDPPRLMLLDCADASPLSDPARQQSSAPYWDPPECPISPPPGQRRQQYLQDTVTDTYKLGLAGLALPHSRQRGTLEQIGEPIRR